MGIPEALLAAGLPPLARAAWVEVSLDAIANNVRSLKARLPEGGHLDVVLKSNAYGLGAVQIARASIAAGARSVLVATVDEALQLRRAGFSAPLRVLWRVPSEYLREAAQLEIGVPATSPAVVAELLAADLRGVSPLIVDVEVDTGLGRDGILPDELKEQLSLLRAASDRITLRGIWSHLTAAEDIPRSEKQAERLNEVADHLAEPAAGGLSVGLERHLVGSGGLLTIGGAEHVARVGIAPLRRGAECTALYLICRRYWIGPGLSADRSPGSNRNAPCWTRRGLRPAFRREASITHHHPADRLCRWDLVSRQGSRRGARPRSSAPSGRNDCDGLDHD